ncbi:MAG: hypothetical protein JWQ11_4379, partial [Rhizobacter sp.]|nr:hypothetical protein [Rhizobacter sp.]
SSASFGAKSPNRWRPPPTCLGWFVMSSPSRPGSVRYGSPRPSSTQHRSRQLRNALPLPVLAGRPSGADRRTLGGHVPPRKDERGEDRYTGGRGEEAGRADSELRPVGRGRKEPSPERRRRSRRERVTDNRNQLQRRRNDQEKPDHYPGSSGRPLEEEV